MKLESFRTYGLAREVFEECQKLKLKHYLKDQLERASLSVVLNLVEGAAKPTPKEKNRFYSIAYGSNRETQVLLDLVKAPLPLRQKADHTGACLFRLLHPLPPRSP